MIKMIGTNWREVKVEAWTRILRSRGFLAEDALPVTVEELEALVRGSLKLEYMSRMLPLR